MIDPQPYKFVPRKQSTSPFVSLFRRFVWLIGNPRASSLLLQIPNKQLIVSPSKRFVKGEYWRFSDHSGNPLSITRHSRLMCKIGCNMDGDPGWKWNGSKEITLASVMAVLIVIVAILATWNYLTLKRRREEAAVRREVLRVARHAEAKEARKIRRGLIEEALVSSVSI